MSELVVGSIAGLASNSYEVGIASGSTLDLANAKAGSLPDTALSAAPGLKHIHTETFSAVASVAINNVFSATYKRYKILAYISAGSAQALLQYRSGSTNATSGYYTTSMYTEGTGAGYSRSTTLATAVSGASTAESISEIVVSNPFEATATNTMAYNCQPDNANYGYAAWAISKLENTTSYDGIYVAVSSGTISGTIVIYGLED